MFYGAQPAVHGPFRSYQAWLPGLLPLPVLYTQIRKLRREPGGNMSSKRALNGFGALLALILVSFVSVAGCSGSETLTTLATLATPDPAAFRAGSERNAYYGSGGGDIEGTVAWKVDVGSPVASTPAVSGGQLFFGTAGGGSAFEVRDEQSYLYCLNANSGVEEWRFEVPEYIDSSPTVHDGAVYFGCFGGAYCADVKNGARVFSKSVSDMVDETSPILVGDLWVVQTDSNTVVAFDAKDGQRKWLLDSAKIGPIQPWLAADQSYLFCVVSPVLGQGRNNSLTAVDMLTAQKVWSFELGSDSEWRWYEPVVSEGVVYVGTVEGYLFAVDVASGKEIWRYRTGTDARWAPAVGEGAVFLPCPDDYIYAIDAKNGSLRWRYPSRYAILSRPSIAGGVVYTGDWDDQLGSCLTALDALTGLPRWRLAVDGTITEAPAICGGAIYFGTDHGWVYAIR
jgi:eukaryotic-like serine/threonine-protein kinase